MQLDSLVIRVINDTINQNYNQKIITYLFILASNAVFGELIK